MGERGRLDVRAGDSAEVVLYASLEHFRSLFSLNVGYSLTRSMKRSGALLNWFHRFNGPWRSTDD